jgi:hypothetical protein
MEAETFVPCTKELSHGSEWLVYHKDNTYLFWTKKNIHTIKIVTQKKTHYQLAVYSTLHPEGEAIKCTASAEQMEELKNWLAAQI